MNGLDLGEVLRRALKYLVEGVMVGLAAMLVSQGRKGSKLDAQEILILGVTAAFVFAILDMYAPSVAVGTRTGAGLGVGMNLVGFPM